MFTKLIIANILKLSFSLEQFLKLIGQRVHRWFSMQETTCILKEIQAQM